MEKSATTTSGFSSSLLLLLQRFIVTVLAIILMKQFQESGLKTFLVPGEYLVPPFFLLPILQEEVYGGNNKKLCGYVGLWDFAFVFLLLCDYYFLSLPTTYILLIIGILIQSYFLSSDLIRQLHKSEEINRKKKNDDDDDDEEFLSIVKKLPKPKNDEELSELRFVETYLRKEKKFQRYMKEKEAVKLSGLNRKEANTITII